MAALSGVTYAAPPAPAGAPPSNSTAEIKALISRLHGGEGGYQIAIELARYKKEAMPFLIEGLKSPDPNTRKWCARAMTNTVGGYGDFSGGPDAESGGMPLLDALAAEQDEAVAWYMIQAIGCIQPDPQKGLPVLLRILGRKGTKLKGAVVEALRLYASKARAAKPALIAMALGKTETSLQDDVFWALESIGIDENDAMQLSAVRFAERSWMEIRAASTLLCLLLDYPTATIAFLKAHPGILEHGEPWAVNALTRVLEDRSPAKASLRDYLLKREDLPSLVMARLQDPALLPAIKKRIERAAPHERTFLEACARALGKPPKRIVRISEKVPGDFKPKSAWPQIDENRWADGGGHSDGYTTILITGRLLMSDGSPAVDPRFFDVNDRMLLGQKRKDPAHIRYDPKTGRLVFVTNVFAAYAVAEGQKEPGPYQTGRAKVVIEAAGAKPLEVSFYDEMPEVEITLSKADARVPAKGASPPPQETEEEGNGTAIPRPVSPLDCP